MSDDKDKITDEQIDHMMNTVDHADRATRAIMGGKGYALTVLTENGWETFWNGKLSELMYGVRLLDGELYTIAAGEHEDTNE